MLNIWHDLGRPVIGLPVLGMVAVVAIFSVRWLNRRRRPDPASIEPVEFSGRTRAAFLQRVWAQRIVNGLESSLQHAAEIALGMRNTPELVKLSYSESTAEPGELLSVEEAYELRFHAPAKRKRGRALDRRGAKKRPRHPPDSPFAALRDLKFHR